MAAVSGSSGDVLPPSCSEYEYDQWPSLNAAQGNLLDVFD